jgi:hypothetical protein
LAEQILEVKNNIVEEGSRLPESTNQLKTDNGDQEVSSTNQHLDTTHLESQIDELVFELCGLSEEEKSTVIDSL